MLRGAAMGSQNDRESQPGPRRHACFQRDTQGAGDYRGEDHPSEHVSTPGDTSPQAVPHECLYKTHHELVSPRGTGTATGGRLGVLRGNCHRGESAESGLATARHRPGPAAPSRANTPAHLGQMSCRKWVLTAFLTQRVQGFSRPYTSK